MKFIIVVLGMLFVGAIFSFSMSSMNTPSDPFARLGVLVVIEAFVGNRLARILDR